MPLSTCFLYAAFGIRTLTSSRSVKLIYLLRILLLLATSEIIAFFSPS